MINKNTSHSPKAAKFQRFLFGILLLIAFIVDWLPLVMVVAVLMVLFVFLPVRFSPFYRLYLLLSRGEENECMCSNGEVSFACLVGGVVLVLAIYLDFIGLKTAAWMLILLVAAMSLLAGTTGFCLGSLVYAWLKRIF